MSKRFCDQPYYFGFANELPPDDDRLKTLEKEFNDIGIDGTYSWSTDYTIAKFIVKVLKDLRSRDVGYPASLDNQEEWYAIIDEMIEGFRAYTEEDIVSEYNEESQAIHDAKVNKALELFSKWFGALWT